MFAQYYFNNPTHVTLPQSTKAFSTSWISCFATTRWSVVTLDPGKRQMNILLLVDTAIERASPSHARQE